MRENEFIKISKVVSHILRHEPTAYGLKLDNDGWVFLNDLVLSLKKHDFENIEKEDIVLMVERSQKKRHQIVGDKIRAYYGHSTSEKIIKQDHWPPEILYHGTSENNISNILEKGLLPMDRQYVHLSVNKELAAIVAGRRKGKSVILEINAIDARKGGVLFYMEENGVWLSDVIPSKYIDVLSQTPRFSALASVPTNNK